MPSRQQCYDAIVRYQKKIAWLQAELQRQDALPATCGCGAAATVAGRCLRCSQREASRKRRGMPSENRHLMQQEYPCTPEEAFLLSGQKFLIRPVPSVPKRQADDSGIIRLYDFDPTHQYSAGCDVASGSETGDFSTIIIGDVTMRKVAASMIIRMPTIDFIKKGRALLEEYGDPITAPETGSEGPIVADSWALAGVPVFQMVTITGNEQQILPRLGWRTTPDTRPLVFGSIYEATGGMDRWEIGDYRLVDELNALCYNKNHKPAAPKGGHDDGSVGFGLMIQAIPQVRQAREKVIEEVKDVNPLSYYENLMNSAETDTRRDFFDSPDSWKAGDFF